MTLSPLGEAALDYAARGWPVLPLHSPKDGACSCGRADCGSVGKHPRTSSGLKDASADRSVIEKWWGEWPDANVGLLTGASMDVLDLDSPDAVAEFELLVWNEHRDPGVLPAAYTSKGMHFYFAPTGNRNLAGFRPGWDWRGAQGYVVAPPSVHASGTAYTWRVSVNGSIPKAPDFLLQLLSARSTTTNAATGAPIAEGGRNSTLASLAGAMRRKAMSPAAIEAALLAENQARCQPPLDDAEVRRIAKSVSRYAPTSEIPPVPDSDGVDIECHKCGKTDPAEFGHGQLTRARDGKRLQMCTKCWSSGRRSAVEGLGTERPDRGTDRPEREELPFSLTAAEFCSEEDGETAGSIVPGILVAESLTEVDALPKVGKTTFEMEMIRAITTGGEFLGRQCVQGPVVLISEESAPTLRAAIRRAGLDASPDLHIVQGMVTRARPWPEVVAEAVDLAERVGANTLAVDTLPGLAALEADAENDSGAALLAIAPLRMAADAGLAVLINRHERLAGGNVGESGRGSSAYAGAVDTIFTLRRVEDASSPNVRQLKGLSRFSDCPAELDIEWTGDGYVSRGEPAAHAAQVQDAELLAVLPLGVGDALSAEKLAESVPKLSPRRAREKLEVLVESHRIGRVGAGRKGDPHLYYAFFTPSQSENPDIPADFPAESGRSAGTAPDLISDIPADSQSPETPESISGGSAPRILAVGGSPKGESPHPPESSPEWAAREEGLRSGVVGERFSEPGNEAAAAASKPVLGSDSGQPRVAKPEVEV